MTYLESTIRMLIHAEELRRNHASVANTERVMECVRYLEIINKQEWKHGVHSNGIQV